jgi:hypothetical protein
MKERIPDACPEQEPSSTRSEHEIGQCDLSLCKRDHDRISGTIWHNLPPSSESLADTMAQAT